MDENGWGPKIQSSVRISFALNNQTKIRMAATEEIEGVEEDR
jgi:hypothetical protein